MMYGFSEDALVFNDEEGIVVAAFKFGGDWSSNTVEMGGESYNVPIGFEDDRIGEWMENQPGYGYAEYAGTEVMVFCRRIAFGPMFIVCIADASCTVPARTIAKVVFFERPDYTAGEWEVSLFDGDEERDFVYRLSKDGFTDPEQPYYQITP